ncbi:[FeFe] hydrogenase H-cluster maturation GTPase HydF [Romboutsia weinsteinii]|uniref:[FeFe] hydrogenase H-cluster maturation GTPase HydF n=1 Tax=Romboutsia weinsteinii TaxID=2020949 RepID=A0A371IZH0_9FIRM|nr:[FeFe] hydrogenase H-cluster maturation GTPase HydF [Romboutsia weinsteinii]RDY25891.1 [FeFe] hydrogenase H-cluster maturation GTPase HydF [Romboutsia weinsteinii]
MSLNSTPQSVRVHIGLFGKRNSGKSSIINAISNQEISIVSDVLGTTTDPVFRPMEILPIGPCVLIDTAGVDDFGELGKLRVDKSLDVLDKTDIALLVVDASLGLSEEDLSLISTFKSKSIPYILVLNKIDHLVNTSEVLSNTKKLTEAPVICVSTTKNIGLENLKQEIIKTTNCESTEFTLVSDLINPNDIVILVIPIDKAAPKGRLILPQQQVIRDILDSSCQVFITKEDKLKDTLNNINKKPALVITDSQAFEQVAKDTPSDIPLTSFSILFAKQKGDLSELIKGATYIDNLVDNDTILIAEGCTHHKQTDDIGTVKIPNMLRQRTNKKLNFEFASGVSFDKDLKKYALIVHCGACMMNRASMMSRIEIAKNQDIPIVNYGVLIAYIKGILDRSIAPVILPCTSKV